MFKLKHNRNVEQFITPEIYNTLDMWNRFTIYIFGKCKTLQFCHIIELRFP
jgi:hypothetical protein